MAGTVQFRDPRTFAPLGGPVTVAEGVVVSLAFSPDGSLLAAGDFKSAAVSTIRLVDVATHQTVGEPLAGLAAVSPSFSPDGTTMATSSLSNTLLWNLDPAICVSARARSPAAASRMQRCASTFPTTPMRRPRAPNSRDLTLVKAIRDAASSQARTPPTGVRPNDDAFVSATLVVGAFAHDDPRPPGAPRRSAAPGPPAQHDRPRTCRATRLEG